VIKHRIEAESDTMQGVLLNDATLQQLDQNSLAYYKPEQTAEEGSDSKVQVHQDT
jgi:hypothetical protein